jgi:hypothetical protein
MIDLEAIRARNGEIEFWIFIRANELEEFVEPTQRAAFPRPSRLHLLLI